MQRTRMISQQQQQQQQVWCPETSYALGSEEGGRGSLLHGLLASSSSSEQEQEAKATEKAKARKKAVIPRRRTPTLCIDLQQPPKRQDSSVASDNPSTEQGIKKPLASTSSPTYKTIEIKSELQHSLLQLSHQAYHKSNTKSNTFCGWTDSEHDDLQQQQQVATSAKVPWQPQGHGTEPGDRSKLQTPLDGRRSALQSRISSSRQNSSNIPSSSSRAGSRYRASHTSYTFQHFDTPEEYAANYLELYSYTTLHSSSNSREEDEKLLYCSCGEGEEVEQDAEVILPLGVKSLYRGDPYILELVSRLGIREPPPPPPPLLENWQGQLLLTQPRPTPPSIVKRKRNERDTVNIVVSNSAAKRLLLCWPQPSFTAFPAFSLVATLVGI